jgi:hypothetical protein
MHILYGLKRWIGNLCTVKFEQSKVWPILYIVWDLARIIRIPHKKVS